MSPNEREKTIPEILQLYERYGSWNRAEKAIGVSQGFLAGILRGHYSYTAKMKERVLAGIKWKEENGDAAPPKAPKGKVAIPDECPPLLADLLRHCGSVKQTREVLGTSDGTFYPVMNGTKPMPPAWEVRAKAHMGMSVIGSKAREQMEDAGDKGPAIVIPEFVPWDGKLASVTVRGSPGSKPKVLKGVPEPLAKLIEKHDGSRAAAAGAMGRTVGYLYPFFDKPKEKFLEKAQRAVHNALHGVAPPVQHSMGEEYDKYELGIAICLLGQGSFDRIHDIAEILNGRLAFKKNTKGGWMLIYRMAVEDLPKFKRLALRDANEIVCP